MTDPDPFAEVRYWPANGSIGLPPLDHWLQIGRNRTHVLYPAVDGRPADTQSWEPTPAIWSRRSRPPAWLDSRRGHRRCSSRHRSARLRALAGCDLRRLQPSKSMAASAGSVVLATTGEAWLRLRCIGTNHHWPATIRPDSVRSAGRSKDWMQHAEPDDKLWYVSHHQDRLMAPPACRRPAESFCSLTEPRVFKQVDAYKRFPGKVPTL